MIKTFLSLSLVILSLIACSSTTDVSGPSDAATNAHGACDDCLQPSLNADGTVLFSCVQNQCRCADTSKTLCTNVCVNLTAELNDDHCSSCDNACGPGMSCQTSSSGPACKIK